MLWSNISVSCGAPALINYLLSTAYFIFDFFPADSFQFQFSASHSISVRFFLPFDYFSRVSFPQFRFISVLCSFDCATDWHIPAGESNLCCSEVAGPAHLSS